ncbi:unnamed protein product [Leptidea sinapis]|uniref:Uncharacterized protein n=1 Tax=Leptidea sinapis TaxID=189913 RepID=A0A5E4PQF1_9NEOP|nr:unnamed protein product [Leptidea sinapis]
MCKVCIALIFAAVVQNIQCRPASETQSVANHQLHLLVANSSDTTNYQLTPIMAKMSNIDEEINNQLKAKLAFIELPFNAKHSLKSSSDNDDSEECKDQMIVMLVPEDELDLNSDDTSEEEKNPKIPTDFD